MYNSVFYKILNFSIFLVYLFLCCRSSNVLGNDIETKGKDLSSKKETKLNDTSKKESNASSEALKLNDLIAKFEGDSLNFSSFFNSSDGFITSFNKSNDPNLVVPMPGNFLDSKEMADNVLIELVEQKMQEKLDEIFERVKINLKLLSEKVFEKEENINKIYNEFQLLKINLTKELELERMNHTINEILASQEKVNNVVLKKMENNITKILKKHDDVLEEQKERLDNILDDLDGTVACKINEFDVYINKQINEYKFSFQKDFKELKSQSMAHELSLANFKIEITNLRTKFEQFWLSLYNNVKAFISQMSSAQEVGWVHYTNLAEEKLTNKMEICQKKINDISFDKLYIKTMINKSIENLKTYDVVSSEFTALKQNLNFDVFREIFLHQFEEANGHKNVYKVFVFSKEDEVNEEYMKYYLIPSVEMLHYIKMELEKEKLVDYSVLVVDRLFTEFYSAPNTMSTFRTLTDEKPTMAYIDNYGKELDFYLKINNDHLNFGDSSTNQNVKLLLVYVGSAPSTLYSPRHTLVWTYQQLSVGKKLTKEKVYLSHPEYAMMVKKVKEEMDFVENVEFYLSSHVLSKKLAWEYVMHDKDMVVCIVKGRFRKLSVPFTPFFKNTSLLLKIELAHIKMLYMSYYIYPSIKMLLRAVKELVNHSSPGGSFVTISANENSGIKKYFISSNTVELRLHTYKEPDGFLINKETFSLNSSLNLRNVCEYIKDSIYTHIIPMQFKASMRGKILFVHICVKNVDC